MRFVGGFFVTMGSFSDGGREGELSLSRWSLRCGAVLGLLLMGGC